MLFISDTNHVILFLQHVFCPVEVKSSDRNVPGRTLLVGELVLRTGFGM